MVSVRFIKKLLIVTFIFFLFWGVGLLFFVSSVKGGTRNTIPLFDSIIVLTGGTSRIETALDLFLDHPGKKLYISGVYPGTPMQARIKAHGVPFSIIKKDITIDTKAQNTVDNAQMGTSWLRQNKLHKALIVTANYHMPRSLLEFEVSAPDIDFIPYPVSPEVVLLEEWWRWPGTRALMVQEYTKFLIAKVKSWHFLG